MLSHSGYKDQIVLINGSNADPESRAIYENWRKRHAGTDAISGSRSADIKAALVEEFKNRATLLIATESAAEGVNLQFCSLVVNYDLPWNPQRIEQRIGRCHRYGQKHDVVVLNFINTKNAADQRVFELLSEKFRLFDGVFGASDEVLGVIESGVDFEKRIAQLYQECRTAEEIQSEFDKLQAELDEQIQSRMLDTRRILLENFDEEVQARLNVHKEQAHAALSQRQQWLLRLTQQELDGQAKFDKEKPRFYYSGDIVKQGYYNFDWKNAEELGDIFYRLDYPLAQHVVNKALNRKLELGSLVFDYTNHGTKLSALEPFVGKSGWLELSKLTVESFDIEEFLVFAAFSDDAQILDEDQCKKLLSISARVQNASGLLLPDSCIAEV
ncbi:MAG TPA: helicase-related protein, partial [Armatimonadota bacterium]|nr:helicase-related protein [Armatimonadota bacterium]